MEQIKRKAARKGKSAARKKAKGAARKGKAAASKAKRAATPFKKRLAAAKKSVTVTVARGPVSPAAREIIRSTSANLDLALRRLADR